VDNQIKDKIESILGEDIMDSNAQGGGCIADSQLITSSSGKAYFLKQGFSNGMFKNEANGLREIERSGSIRTPNIIVVEDNFLLLEFITQGLKTKEAMYDFGCDLALMHKFLGKSYGFYEDNFIGANPQINTESDSWGDFYFNNRLKYQYQQAEQNGYVTPELKRKFLQLEKIFHFIIESSAEPPSLLHGDLWGGNYLIDENKKAVLIDPAVYYGHREADLAMTKLFGGFSTEFYEGYQHTFPLNEGFQYREKIYLLYHVLNHLNLFGRGYYSQTISLIDFYLDV